MFYMHSLGIFEKTKSKSQTNPDLNQVRLERHNWQPIIDGGWGECRVEAVEVNRIPPTERVISHSCIPLTFRTDGNIL